MKIGILSLLFGEVGIESKCETDCLPLVFPELLILRLRSLYPPHAKNVLVHQGPYSWKILVLRVAPSNTILRKFLEMWVFPLKFKEKILVKKKVIQKAS